jgi:hypothetical protein
MDFHYFGLLDKMSMISLILLLLIIFTYYTNTITISPYGIKSISLFKKMKYPWEEVESIGVTLEDFNVTNGDYVSFFLVYVGTHKDIDRPAQIKGDRDGIITFRFRPEMMHHILCVCDRRVDRLFCVKKWKKYLIRKGYLCI